MKIGRIQTDYIFDTAKFEARMAKASAHLKRMMFIKETARIMAPRPFLPRNDSRFTKFLQERKMSKKKCGECGQELPALAIEGIGRYLLRNGDTATITVDNESNVSPFSGTMAKRLPRANQRKWWWRRDGTFHDGHHRPEYDVVERIGDLGRPAIAISGVGVYGLRNGDVATITVDDKSDNAPFGGRIDSRPDDVLKWWWLRSGESYTVAGKEDYDVVERISDLPYDESQMKKWARWRAWSPLSKRWRQFENEPRIIDGSYWPIGGRNKKIKKPKAPPAPAEGVRWQDTLKESEK